MWVMNTKQILFTIAIIAAISAATVVTPVMAQNMTGGNMTGKISRAEEDAECSKSPACIT
jgi:hypothetical protein